MIDITVVAWCEAISHGKVWGVDDAPRFREAFTTLAATFNQWPTPRQFLEAIPPRPRVIEKPVLRIVNDEHEAKSSVLREESKKRIDAIIADIASKLKIS